MEAESLIHSAELVIQQMTDYPREVLRALQPDQRAYLIEQLAGFKTRAELVRSSPELVALADSICRLVEDLPALRSLFFEPQFDVAQAQLKRKLSLTDQAMAAGAGQYTQTRAIQIRNTVLECRDELQKALGEIENQPAPGPKAKDEHPAGAR